jgi:DNA-binding beta-propeller fold protein YncE
VRFLVAACACALASASAAVAGPDKQLLPTGQALTPVVEPGEAFSPFVTGIGPVPSFVADGAAAIAISPDKREMLVLTSGYNRVNGKDGKLITEQSTQYLFRYAIGASGAKLVQTLQVPNSFGGVAWVPDGSSVVVGGGVDDCLYLFSRKGADLVATGKIKLGHSAGLGADVKPQAAGVAISPDGHRALVANYYNDSVTLIDLDKRAILTEQDLRPGKIDPRMSGVAGGEFPFTVSWTERDRAWVTAPRDRQIVSIHITGNQIRVTRRVPTVGEPTALYHDARKGQLIATEDNADRLAILDTRTGELVVEPRLRLPAALAAPALGKGLNPNGLAALPDGRLLVTLGGINALAVVDSALRRNPVQALIPTGWYPSAVATSADGMRLFIANRKGPPGPNPQGCAPQLAIYRGQPNACGAANQYIFQLEKGGLLDLPTPGPRTLRQMTNQVGSNLGLSDAAARRAAEASMALLSQRIKHVVFIIKENRTYDQVLGDLEVGNGDPHLAILGAVLSPNHHRLARQFVTLDNFYVSGEQSSTGWTWSTAARTTDLLEKTAPVNYADRGLAYESEEADRSIYEQQSHADRVTTNPALSPDPDLLAGPALLTAPDADGDDRPNQGYLWDAAIRAGVSVRNYGFSDASIYDAGVPGSVPLVREPFKEHRRIYTPGDKLLASRSDPYFRGFDQKLADYWRFLEWQREYDQQEASETLPALTLLRLSHDHFGEFDKAVDGVNTVETEMADNDFSLGLVVERIAHGKAANSTLVFVLEDDAQNGADHVDARRSPAFVVGPYVRQGALISTRYTTVNMLRTIESLLGLKPLSLNDALAMPMADLFDLKQEQWNYRAQAAAVLKGTQLPIAADRFVAPLATASVNCPRRDAAYWAAAMHDQDFRTEDKLHTSAFNAALWHGLGVGTEPAAHDNRNLRSGRAALLRGSDLAPCAGLMSDSQPLQTLAG